MKTKFSCYLTLVLVLMMQFAFAQNQTETITGTVTDGDGLPIPGVNITVEGTTTGTATNFDGKYTIEAAEGQVLHFNMVGFKEVTKTVGSSNVINVSMQSGSLLDQVVVTALGISREKRSLGYSTQEVTGKDISQVKTTNFVNALSGRVAGLDVRRNNNFGGSTNIVLRGYSSMTGNNQALFVIDGVPISNQTFSASGQAQAVGNYYDYGNAAADINPEDIASINVLKGAAATALYGSRAANGVIIITTKKGKQKEGFGVVINSGVEVGDIIRKTWPTYQHLYGAGYGGESFRHEDVDGDGVKDVTSNFVDDASYGPKFDPSKLIYQWDAFDPASPNYMKKTPWVAAKNGPITFFETPVALTNSVSIANGTDKGSYRFSYTKKDATGLLPNSNLHRNDFSISGKFDVTDKLSVSGFANYIKTKTLGRNSTGYNDNVVGNMRQWWETNVDLKEMERMYKKTGRNITWNPSSSAAGATPLFWDNPYWTRYENYQNDVRKRFIGKIQLDYEVNDWLSLMGKISTDTYTFNIEERRAVGSVAANFGVLRGDVDSGYYRRDITHYETNYQLMANFNTDITELLNFSGLIGWNIRRTENNELAQSTAGGLLVPGLYSLQNGRNASPNPVENYGRVGVNGIFASASFGYDHMLFLDASIRRDIASTLPKDNRVFWYPSISGSFVFSELFDNHDFLNFGKLRLNYAEVGAPAPFDRLMDTYVIRDDIGTSMPATHNNKDLKPERTRSFEAGLEMQFLKNRVGLTVDFYNTKTINEIMAAPVSTSTGYSAKLINAGTMRNKGVELTLSATPVKTKDFTWNLNVNWSTNKNEVVDLPKGINSIVLGSFQGGVTIQARKGEEYGSIVGTDYVYKDGQRLINGESDPTEPGYGMYQKTSTSNNVIGNMLPDWKMGISNSVSYKNLSLSFLIDIQHGGDVFSLDQYYGEATGLYPNTAFINDNGVNVREPIANGGGFINPGILPNGQPNTHRVSAESYGKFGYKGYPNSQFVYDASYIKLRQVALTYTLPTRLLKNTFLSGVSFSLTGSNLWIIHKNIPYADPEAGLSAGNLQGYITGALPTTRRYGFNVRLQF